MRDKTPSRQFALVDDKNLNDFEGPLLSPPMANAIFWRVAMDRASNHISSTSHALLSFDVDAEKFVYSARDNRLFRMPASDEMTASDMFSDTSEPFHLSFPPLATTIRPRTLEFVITGACNLACSYCATRERYKLPNGKNDILDEGTAFSFLELVHPFLTGQDVTLKFFGGEPLLGVGVIKAIVEKLKAWNIKSEKIIATNGLLLSDEITDFLIENAFLTLISLDGPQEIHDTNRVDHTGKGSYEKVLENVKRFRTRHPRVFESLVAFNLVVSPRFAGQFRQQVEHLLSLGISSTQINPNDCAATSESCTRYSLQQWQAMQQEKVAVREMLIAKRYQEGRSEEIDCFETYAGLNSGSNDWEKLPEELAGTYNCRDCQAFEWNTLTLLPDGSISSCIEFERVEFVSFGDAKKGVLDIAALVRFQEGFRRSVQSGSCAHCWAVRVCPMVSCYKTFASSGAQPNWQREEDCNLVREEMASRFRDAVKLHLLR
ncbi:radical SAM protein [Methylocystis sp.]|uniref:radical SAM protein n=1 Tax=Methylocystis sp. TaxID=1911079 RepID=UPI003DA61073